MGDPERNSADKTSAEQADRLYRRSLMSYFQRRVGNRAEAEDLTQQVFLRLFGVAEGGEAVHSGAYVFTIAANLLRDRARKLSRQFDGPTLDQRLIDDLVQELSEERTPERILLSRETLEGVLRSLDELGERTRDIFILFRLEQMKQRDIAALYGIGQSTVEKHIMKATLHLARKYGTN